MTNTQTKTKVHTTTLQFPEIELQTSDAHKLRGYFGNLFKEHSSILHNHFEDGSSIYRYPLVQYKVVNKVPTLVGLNEGAKLMTDLFLSIKELKIREQIIPVLHKNFESHEVEIGLDTRLHSYQFKNLWMALNQKNYEKYLNENEEGREELLRRTLIGNILSFFKSFSYRAEEQIMVHLHLQEKNTQFKNQKMIAFSGGFIANVRLPQMVGLGKSVARGFGTIQCLDK